MIEFIYDNFSGEYVVYDNHLHDAIFVGEYQEAVNEYHLALFSVPTPGANNAKS